MNNIITEIESLTSNNKFGKALELLKSHIKDKETRNKIIILQSQLKAIESASLIGIESEVSLNIQKNKIAYAILSLLSFIEEAENTGVNGDNTILEEILANLRTNYQIYKRIRKLRESLADRLESRLEKLPANDYISLFSKCYPYMNSIELQEHQILRDYTKNVLKKHNDRILELIKTYPHLKNRIQKLGDLEVHLIIWDTEYNNTLAKDESICQVYVVGEESRFPDGIENEIRDFIDKN